MKTRIHQYAPVRPGQVQYAVTTGQQVDVTGIVNQIIPILVIAMLFGIMTPMIKEFGGAR